MIVLLASKDNVPAQKLYESLDYLKEVGYINFINQNSQENI